MFSGDITYLQLAYTRVDENFRRNTNFVIGEETLRASETYRRHSNAGKWACPLRVTLHQEFRGVENEGDDISLLSADSASRYRRPAWWFLLILLWESINILLTQTVEILFTFSHSIGKFRHARTHGSSHKELFAHVRKKSMFPRQTNSGQI